MEVKMKWFKPKYRVCSECVVHFEPRDDMWPDLCQTHMEPVRAAYYRKLTLLLWVDNNISKIEELMQKDEAVANAVRNKQYQDLYASAQKNQQSGNLMDALGRGLY